MSSADSAQLRLKAALSLKRFFSMSPIENALFTRLMPSVLIAAFSQCLVNTS